MVLQAGARGRIIAKQEPAFASGDSISRWVCSWGRIAPEAPCSLYLEQNIKDLTRKEGITVTPMSIFKTSNTRMCEQGCPPSQVTL